MRVIFTKHASDEMGERRITRSQVREVLEGYDTSYPGTNRKRKTTVLTATVDGRRLAVVVEASNSETTTVVVTTYWRDE
jgi:Domain of unknown function (DUF4258)